MTLGKQHASLGFSLRYWLDSTPDGSQRPGRALHVDPGDPTISDAALDEGRDWECMK
jgi:hypothetical protein